MKTTLFACLLLLVTSVQAGNWPQWRGPHFNGSSDERNLPTSWSKTKNIAWSVDLPGPAASTPVVWEDHVFVSSTDLNNESLVAICFDRKTGKKLWQHSVGEKKIRRDYRSTFAAPSPVTDGKIVIFFYGNGEIVGYDFAGKEQWSKNVGPFAFQWTFSTSPLLFDGKLFLQVLQRDVAVRGRGVKGKNDSYLLAMHPQTGKTLWRHVRPSKAKAESLESFNTPIPFEHNGRKELVLAGGDALTGHDLETGKELWRWGTWNPTRIGHWRLVPSPVASKDVILVCAPKRDPVYAIKAGGQGTLGDDDVAWISKEERAISSDAPTPAYYDGDFFLLSDVRKSLSRIEPKSGKIKWTVKTPGRVKYEASPLAADGKIYIVNFDGDVSVINAADGKIISAAIPMDDRREEGVVRSSVIAAHGQLFVRTNRKLYCIGK